MLVNIYKNYSDNNYVNKDIEPIKSAISAKIKEETSVTDPIFILQSTDMDIKQANYVYVAELDRYYYITNITMRTSSIIELSCHIDVLMSYKSQFLELEAVIQRQQNKYNTYFNDEYFCLYNKKKLVQKTFPNGFRPTNGINVLIMSGG